MEDEPSAKKIPTRAGITLKDESRVKKFPPTARTPGAKVKIKFSSAPLVDNQPELATILVGIGTVLTAAALHSIGPVVHTKGFE